MQIILFRNYLEGLIMARTAALPILTAEPGLTHYFEEIRRFPMLERQEEYMLAKRWREHGDRDAAHKLATSAVWWIKAAIQEYILRSWSLVKMGTTANQKKVFFNLRKAQSKISILDEGDMRLDQVKIIARRIGVTETDVIYMNRRLGGDASLNAAIREDGDSGEWQDCLVDESPDQETTLAASEELDNRRKTLSSALTVLNKRERRIFETRPARRGTDHARGAGRGIRRLARARAPDRGGRLREGAECGEAPRRGDGDPGASAGALASNPLPG